MAEPPGAEWRIVLHRPPSGLGGVVRRVAGFSERAGRPVHRTELPSCMVPIILSFGDELRISSATGAAGYTSFLAGLHEIPVHTAHAGTLRCVQIDLTPLGAYQLLGTPMGELRDRVLAVDEVLGPTWASLADRLAELPNWAERFALLDEVLGKTADAGVEPDPEICWAWRQLASSHGAVAIGELAEEVGWSRRHFTARFRQQVGLAPKAAAQVLRFTRAYALLNAPGGGSISDAAAQAGYADHSHLVREFRRLAGAAPSQLLARAG